MSNHIIPYGKQSISEDDIQEVIKTLKSDYLTQGPQINAFEKAFAAYVGAEYAVAVSNGTAALHLSVMTLGLKSGQKVITTPITFAASANCIRYCEGEVVFCDIDPETYLIDLKKVTKLLQSSAEGEFVGIVPVDFAGRPVDLEKLRSIADEFGLWILEDSCHAPGGYFQDSNSEKQKCGGGKYADLSIFSFHPVKHIAAGEGGMITTNNEGLYNRLLQLRTHGITKKQDAFINSKEIAFGRNVDDENWPGWYMEMQDLGFNYRITDIQAALGLSQLKRASKGLERRREIAKIYTRELSKLNGLKGMSDIVEGHAYHLFIILVQRRLELYNFLREHNIFTQVHYIPVHLMPYYQALGWRKGDMPIAEEYYASCLSLPMYPSLSDEDLNFVITKIKDFLS